MSADKGDPFHVTKLQGKAWRATERRSTLTANLPETELNERVDEFLFDLKRRPHEGVTQCVSRFRSTLSRLETLVAADRMAQQARKRKHKGRTMAVDPLSLSPSRSQTSSEFSEISEGLSKEKVEARDRASAAAAAASDVPVESCIAKTVGSLVGEGGSPQKRRGTSEASRGSGYGSQQADNEKAQLKMMRQLELLEEGHTRACPIFQEVVLGHLFMKKYGLTREQRATVVTTTGGSSRFSDLELETIMRASDFEHCRGEAGRHIRPA